MSEPESWTTTADGVVIDPATGLPFEDPKPGVGLLALGLLAALVAVAELVLVAVSGWSLLTGHYARCAAYGVWAIMLRRVLDGKG